VEQWIERDAGNPETVINFRPEISFQQAVESRRDCGTYYKKVAFAENELHSSYRGSQAPEQKTAQNK